MQIIVVLVFFLITTTCIVENLNYVLNVFFLLTLIRNNAYALCVIEIDLVVTEPSQTVQKGKEVRFWWIRPY